MQRNFLFPSIIIFFTSISCSNNISSIPSDSLAENRCLVVILNWIYIGFVSYTFYINYILFPTIKKKTYFSLGLHIIGTLSAIAVVAGSLGVLLLLAPVCTTEVLRFPFPFPSPESFLDASSSESRSDPSEIDPALDGNSLTTRDTLAVSCCK